VCEDRLLAAFRAAPEVFATDEALRLVVEGVPFRDAYRQVAASLDKLQAADPRKSIAQRTHAGGPANLRLDLAGATIDRLREFVEDRRDRLRRALDALLGGVKTG
jgi:argininosuccinate lyase